MFVKISKAILKFPYRGVDETEEIIINTDNIIAVEKDDYFWCNRIIFKGKECVLTPVKFEDILSMWNAK